MNSAGRALAALLADLLRLRGGPQDVLYSPNLLLLALIPYALLGSALAAFSMPLSKALLYGPSEAGLLALLVYGALALRQRRARYVQTLTALVLVGSVFNLLSLPVTALANGGVGAATLLLLLLLGWSFAVSVHLLRHALEIPVPGSILVNLGFFFIAYFALGHLFGLLR